MSGLFLQGRASYDADNLFEGGVYFLSVFSAVLVCSALFYRFVDKPVERLRRTIRSRAQLRRP